MTNFYDPMDVTIERDADDPRMSGPVPEFDASWSQIDRLRWHAGCIKARTGITVQFHDGAKAGGPGYSYEWPELIGVQAGGISTSMSAQEIWCYLRGIEHGAEAANRMQANDV